MKAYSINSSCPHKQNVERGGSLTPAILLRRTNNNAAGKRIEPAPSVRRQQQLLVRKRTLHS